MNSTLTRMAVAIDRLDGKLKTLCSLQGVDVNLARDLVRDIAERGCRMEDAFEIVIFNLARANTPELAAVYLAELGAGGRR